MQRDSRPNGLNLPSPLPQRSRSLSSADRTPSVSGSSLAASPPVSPEPAYIAASAASQIVSTDRADRGLDMFDGEGKKVQIDTAVVSPGSLSLVNSFLDQLLYSFLAGSHSTSIAALRPAIAEVLKPRLAKEAIAGADEELQGYMTGGDAEELLAFHSGQEFRGDYDLNLVWRKTRLRCMVYTRLGDMEEDDEEMYLEQEREENGNDGRPRLSRDLGSVSPAAAIFLTSILEFLGEHALLVASEAACNRAHTKPPHPENLRAIVEEIDMEKLAFNGTLGRLWRSWKKRVRSSSLLSPRETARDLGRRQASLMSDSTGRKTSISEGDEPGYFGSETLPSATKGFAEKSAPTAVSADMKDLPEEPDFSSFSEELPIPEVDNTNRERRRSMIEFSEQSNETPERAPSQSSARCLSTPSGADKRLAQHRQRSSSLPVFRQKSSEFPMDEAFVTPSEVSNPYNDRGNAERNIPKLMDDVTNVPDLASGGGAASMMYDEPISKSAEVLPEQASKQQFRDVSTKTEFSSTADECDLEVSPRAFDHNQFSTPIAKTHSQSRDSAVLENGSLVVGERGLIAPRESLGERVHGNENQTQGEAYPPRGDSLDQPRDDSDGRTLVSVGNFANLATLQGHQLRTYDDSGKAVKRDIPVLYESPSNKDVIYNPEASIRSSTGPPFDEGKVTIPTMADSQIAGPEKQGMPPLKPLEELVDAAHVNNDAASSNVPSHNVSRSDSFVQGHQSKSSDSLRNGSMLSSSVNPGRETAASGKLIDLRSQPLLVSTGTEKSSVQRVPSFISSPTPPGKTPTGSNRDSRPLTAGSINSHKIKGLLGRDSADLIRQPVPTRNSSEGSSSLVNGSLRTPRSADKEQDFEDLIRSEETVRYTLTPQTVREMEQSSASRSLPASPRYHSHTRSDTSLRGLDGLRSNPIRDSTLGNWRSPQVPHNSPGVVTNHVTVPREPTATNTDLKDFADFIRSTGPAAEQNSTQTPSSAEGKQQGKKITKSNSVDSPGESPVILPQKSEVTPPKRHVSKMQAREATVNRSNTTAELANFLRSDPDGQVDGAGRAMGGLDSATSFDSSLTQGSFAPSKLTQESANSRTALLDTTFGGVEYYEKRRAERIAERIAQAKELARKQGRLTDPNAVESDGGNGGHGAPRPSGPQDESLNDFLRNSTPPPGAATRPGPIGITNAPLHAKQSGLSFRERFSRNVAVIPDNRPVPHKTPRKSSSTNFNPRSDADGNRHIAQRVVSNPSNTFPQSSRPSAHGNHSNSRNNASHLPQPNPHTTIPHLNLQNGTNFGGNPPTHSIPTQHSDRSVRPQARESRGASHPGYIRDLVKFLKETEPEPPLPSEPVKAMNLAKEGSAFGKMFSRKKK